MNRIRTAIIGLTLFTLTSFTSLAPQISAQILGIPVPKIGEGEWENVLAAFPEEAPLAIVAWGKAGQPNPAGNPSEKWLATPGLQKAFKKAKTLLIDAAGKSNDPTLAIWLDGPIWEILKNGGMAALEGFDFTKNKVEFSSVSYKYEADSIKELLVKFDQGNFQEIEIGNDTVHISAEDSNGNALVIGFHGDHLIVASDKELWGKVATRIDAGKQAPGWASDLMAKHKIHRLGSFMYGDLSKVRNFFKTIRPPGGQALEEAQEIMDRIGIDSLFAGWGTDEISNISIIDVQGPSTGLLSSLGAKPMTTEQLGEFPADCSMALGIKLSPENILKLMQEFAPDQPLEKMPSVEFIKNEFEIDLKSDILDHLEGDIRAFSSGSMIKPKMIGVIGIKDEEAFKAAFENINSQVRNRAEQSGAKFSEKTGRDGITVYSYQPPSGRSVFWAMHDSELLFGSNNRTIGSFVRKRENRTDSLTQQELVANILKSDQPEDSDGPVMVQVTDMNQFIQALLPMASLGLQFIPPESGIDISPDDIPSPEDLAGLRPNISIGFKTKSGATMVSRYDTPISIEASTGVLIGMLLPAVQQTRAAARRVRSMNNFRQLALAALNFESAYGRLPAAFSVDKDGQPLLSWRVHILPFLDQQELYKKFHLDEPWDSPHNLKLLEEMPQVFKSSSVTLPDGHTMALAPVTEASAITQDAEDGNLGAKFSDITDGSSNTILFIEGGSENAVPWTAPQDLEMEKQADADFDTGHPGIFCAVFADGSTHCLSRQIGIENVVGGCIINDGVSLAP